MSRLAQNSTCVPEFSPTLSLELQRYHAGLKEDTEDVLEPAISKTKTELNFFLLVKATTLFDDSLRASVLVQPKQFNLTFCVCIRFA